MVAVWFVTMIVDAAVLPLKNRLRVLQAERNWSKKELALLVGV